MRRIKTVSIAVAMGCLVALLFGQASLTDDADGAGNAGRSAPRLPCTHLPVIQAGTGLPLVGIEDMAYDDATGMLYLSAQDRWATDAAEPGRIVASGGIYRASLRDRLDLTAFALMAHRLAVHPNGGDMRPHGIDVARHHGSTVLRVVLRDRPEGTEIAGIRLRDDGSTEPLVPHRHPSLCRANDLVILDEHRTLVTLDGSACGRLEIQAERVLNRPSGDLVLMKGDALTRLVTGLRVANGIAIRDRASAEPLIFVAETRAQRVRPIRLTADGPVHTDPIDLPGSPDNLVIGADGRLAVAIIPSLLRYAAYRYGWALGGPTRSLIAWVEPDGRIGQVRSVPPDPDAGFGGATVALPVGDLVLIGSAVAPGLMRCPLPAADRGSP